MPHDAIAVPLDAVTAAPALADKGTVVRFERLVDARNRAASPAALNGIARDRVTVHAEPSTPAELVAWFVKALE